MLIYRSCCGHLVFACVQKANFRLTESIYKNIISTTCEFAKKKKINELLNKNIMDRKLFR